MWDFYPLKPPRWPSSAHNWEAPGSRKNAPVPPSYSASLWATASCCPTRFVLIDVKQQEPQPVRHDPMSQFKPPYDPKEQTLDERWAM
ncbi:jg7525 [Pararge aegeria aegeria]|uniref:Jg7525 protein n=1 Tax=Pararge aegeria aegeria TaxID=348720 RepID=A0A8S4RFS7_9NEOP|nr:jg7525 [Pararge aegeria aegeria]